VREVFAQQHKETGVSDTSQGPGWWQASDGKWYPPEQAPGYQQAGAPMGAAPGSGNFDVGAALAWSWAKFQANMQPLLILGAIVAGIPFVLAVISGFFGSFLLGLGFWFISVIVSAVLTMLTVQAGWEIASTGQLNQAEMYKLKGNPVGYAVAGLLFTFLAYLGICPGLCIGFVFVWLIFGFWQFAAVGEGQSALNALTRSKEVTMGIGLGNIFIPMLIFMVVGGGAAAFSYGSRFVGIIGVFTLPFSALYGSYTYKTFTGQPIAP
jgi:uncharacterized membrane protein YccF (DUF307 family)